MKTRFAMTCAVLAACAAAPGPAGAERVLNIAASAEVRGARVRLGDIVCDARGLPEGWEAREVLDAPAPGSRRNYPLTAIAYALQRYPDMSDVVLRGGLDMQVRRAYVQIDPEMLVKAVESFVANSAPWQGREVEIRCVQPQKPAPAPAGSFEFAVTGFRERPGKPYGYEFDVQVLVDGAAERVVPVQAEIVPVMDLWVAARPLPQGHVLAPGDLATRRLPMPAGGDGVPACDDVFGRELARPLPAGQPLRRQTLLEPICAKRGDLITVTASSGGLRVDMKARAMAGARRGDTLLCENERSKRRILVRMTGPKEATADVGRR